MRRSLAVFASLLPLAVPTVARADAGDIIVQREPGTSAAEINAGADVKRVETLPIARTEVVDPKGSTGEALAALRADDDVVYAEPDRRVSLDTQRPSSTPSGRSPTPGRASSGSPVRRATTSTRPPPGPRAPARA